MSNLVVHNRVEFTGNLVVHHEVTEQVKVIEGPVYKTDPYPFGRTQEDFVLRA